MAERRRETRRALVVDDDPVLRTLASQALAAMGLEVDEAEDGEQALASVAAAPPDLVLLDVELPGLGGFETCQAIRELPGGSEIPVLVVTGNTDADSVDQAFQAGGTDFVAKPLDWQLLQHRVRFLMRAHDAFANLRDTLGELRESERRLAEAQRVARVGNWEWIPDDEVMLWSGEVHRMFGIPMGPDASTLEAFFLIALPEDREALEKAMQQAAAEGNAFELDHGIRLADGEQRVVHQQAEIVRGGDGRVDRVVGTIQDITDRRRAEEQIRYLAYYDSLTALPNRRMLTEHLNRVVGRARRADEKVALLFLDLDRFKRINDTLGHAVGDAVLRGVADRLMTCVRTTDYVGRPQPRDAATVSRLGGDEFTVVLRSLNSPADAAHVARRILDVMREPFNFEGHRLDLSASIGIALSPEDGSDPDTLLRNADTAMYHAKEQGRDVYQFFSESMNERAMRNLRLEGGLRTGLERGQLVLHYQPVLELATERILAVEALLRWDSPDLGLVSPGEFIPMAEESGLIVPLGNWVLFAACDQVMAWDAAGLPRLRVAVNVSSKQVHKGRLVASVEQVLRETGLEAGRLELEITESSLLADEAVVSESFAGLRELGVTLALDDFGTGYSSLSHLVNFPIQAVKIDRSFVSEIGARGQGNAIVAAVIAMAHRLDLRVTAEGVETGEQREFLSGQGCDLLQGYLIGRPVPAEELEALLRGQR